jgi:hypothetical protein
MANNRGRIRRRVLQRKNEPTAGGAAEVRISGPIAAGVVIGSRNANRPHVANPAYEARQLLALVLHGTLTMEGARALIAVSNAEAAALRKLLDRPRAEAALEERRRILQEFDSAVKTTSSMLEQRKSSTEEKRKTPRCGRSISSLRFQKALRTAC